MDKSLMSVPLGGLVKDPTRGTGVLVDKSGSYPLAIFNSSTKTATIPDNAYGCGNAVAGGVLKDVLEALPHAARRISYGTSGSDPEIFGVDQDGVVIPAWDYMPHKDVASKIGTLKASQQGEVYKAQYAYWDGAQAEITTREGFGCHAHLVDSIQAGLKDIYLALKKHNPLAELVCKDVVEVPREILLSAAEDQVALGCAPSQNIHGIPPIDVGPPREHGLRYSGVHLHYRLYSPVSDARKVNYPDNVLRVMDRTVGVMMTAMGRDMEDHRRRQAYGRPGEFRLTDPVKLGIEYRTPGAFLLSRPEIFNFALDMGRTGYHIGLLYDAELLGLDDTSEIIMNCDADAAWKYILGHKEFFESIIKASYHADKYVANTMKVLESGAKATGIIGKVSDHWLLGENAYWGGHNNGDAASWSHLSYNL